jgi:quercetin dioxygenase-like cupin family protein
MRIVATKDGLQIGPEYFSRAVCVQVMDSWECPCDEVVVNGQHYYAETNGQRVMAPDDYPLTLKQYAARLGEFLKARHDYEATKEASRLSRLKACNANVLDDTDKDSMTLEKSGNIWRRKWKLNCGEHIRGHRHHFDHISLLLTGSVNLLVDGVSTTYTAPAEVFVPKEKEHRVIALEDGTRWWCVFAVRDEAGEVDTLGLSTDLASTQ